MKWIVIIIVIVSYWFLIGIGLNFLLQDEFILSVGAEGDTSFFIPNTTNVNMTTDELIEGRTSLRTFTSSLKVMFGFRTPIPSAIPQTLVVILSFTNWFMVILLGISIYRIINPLA